MTEPKLTLKQQKFADYYIETGNAAEAAIRAGYSTKAARETGYANLSKPLISAYIEKRLSEMASDRIANATEVLETLTAVLRGEKKGVALVGIGRGAQSVEEVEPTVSEKIRAAELLGKRYKLFTDRVETDSTMRVVIVDDI